MKYIRICVMSSADVEKFYGQTTRPYYISENLANLGNEVLHICNLPPKNNSHVIYIKAKEYNNKLKAVRRFKNFKRLYIECKKFSPDVLYAHQISSAIQGLILQRCINIPLVYDAHSSPFLEIDTYENVTLYKRIKWRLHEIAVCKASKKIISASQTTTQYLIKEYNIPKEKIHTVEVGVDCKHFNPNRVNKDIRTNLNIDTSDKVILFTCPRDALNPSNIIALRYFFKIIQKVEKESENIKFVVTGGGECIQPPSDNVIYTGYVDDIVEFINIADVCVMPYPPDAVVGGTRNKLFEYFACEKPVVSTTEGIKGFEKAIPNIHFLLADNISEFASKILLILNNQDLANNLSISARDLALNYDWKNLSLQVNKILAEVISDR